MCRLKTSYCHKKHRVQIQCTSNSSLVKLQEIDFQRLRCPLNDIVGFSYQGYVSAHLILGGVDSTGPHLFEIAHNGATAPSLFTAMGKKFNFSCSRAAIKTPITVNSYSYVCQRFKSNSKKALFLPKW